MKFNAEHIALFDAFLKNQMNDEERKTFEEKLNSDQDFKSRFEAFQEFEQDIAEAEVLAFKDQLAKWDQQSEEKQPAKKGRIISLKLIGLAAVILVVFTVSFFYFNGSTTNQTLVASNFVPYDNILTVRGEKEDLDAGMMLYDSGEYKSAITRFEKYSDNVNAQFYKGEAHLALNEFDSAITSYKTVLLEKGIFSEITEFHIALAYLGKDDVKTAKEFLNLIKNGSDYHSQAQELLAELE